MMCWNGRVPCPVRRGRTQTPSLNNRRPIVYASVSGAVKRCVWQRLCGEETVTDGLALALGWGLLKHGAIQPEAMPAEQSRETGARAFVRGKELCPNVRIVLRRSDLMGQHGVGICMR